MPELYKYQDDDVIIYHDVKTRDGQLIGFDSHEDLTEGSSNLPHVEAATLSVYDQPASDRSGVWVCAARYAGYIVTHNGTRYFVRRSFA